MRKLLILPTVSTILFLSGCAVDTHGRVALPNIQHESQECPGQYNQSSWTNCIGTYIDRSGNKYVGKFKNGTEHGQGTLVFLNGDKYTGEFKDGLIRGYGTKIFSDGNKYVGDWKSGYMWGQGSYRYADGRIKKGKWSADGFRGN